MATLAAATPLTMPTKELEKTAVWPAPPRRCRLKSCPNSMKNPVTPVAWKMDPKMTRRKRTLTDTLRSIPYMPWKPTERLETM